MKKFTIQESFQERDVKRDVIGGVYEEWIFFKEVYGYLDLLNGTDEEGETNSLIEKSSHILIIPEFIEGITDDMRVVYGNRVYNITYSDDPLNVGHHNELYLDYIGVSHE